MTNEEFIKSIKFDGEEWRDVPGWDRYAISSFGRIIAKYSTYKHGNNVYNKNATILKPTPNNKDGGYLTIILSNGNGEQKRRSIHRLVALAFLENPNNYPQINHKDENKQNNNINNLEWCTQKYNNSYGTARTRANKKRRLSAKNRRNIVLLSANNKLINKYSSISLASDDINIPKTTIRNSIIKRCLCRNIYRFMYLEDYENLISMSKNY